MKTTAVDIPADPAWLTTMGFHPVKDCDAWRKNFFSYHLQKLVTVFVPSSSTRLQVTRELERFCPSK